MIISRFLRVFIVVFVSVFLIGASEKKEVDLITLISKYQADQQMLNRKYPVKFSDAYFVRMKAFYESWFSVLNSMPYETFTTDQKIDYHLLKRNIQIADEALKKSEKDTRKISSLLDWSETIIEFQRKRSIGTHINGVDLASKLQRMNTQIMELGVNYKSLSGLQPENFAHAVTVVEQYRRVLTESYKFYEGYDPYFTQVVKEEYMRSDSELKNLSIKFSVDAAITKQVDDGSGIIGKPIGRDAFIKALKDELIDYTPEELHAIALKEFAWSDNEMLKASRDMGFGDEWKQALEKVKQDYVPQGQQPALIKFLADEATDFVVDNDLVTVPDLVREGWSMRMLSAQEQLTSPFFLGGESILIAYPTTGMTDTAKMMSLRGNNRHFARATVHHELIPGHNLQYFMQNRYKTYRRPFSSPFWTEGWALYWEMLLWDKNFAKSPENRVGMLFWRMHRSARIIFSTNYHLGKWTPQQCIDFLVDRVGFERANAEAEVRRSFTGNYGPLYQIAYMIGGLQFRALEKELVQSGKMSYKAFHDKILQNNSMPVDMVRNLLIDAPMPKEYNTNWKFAGKIN